MLGHRGVRLGITYPEITEMQTRAIIEAACRLNKEGLKIVPEIMIPLVGHVKELKDQKAVVDRVAAETMKAAGRQDQVPRRHDDRGAARRHDRRPDRSGGAVLLLRHQRPDASSPSATRATTSASSCASTRRRRSSTRIRSRRSTSEGVGAVVRTGVTLGRKTRPDLKVGVCGEHGGDPASIHFFEKRRTRLRQRVAVPHPRRAPGGGAGGAGGEGRRLTRSEAENLELRALGKLSEHRSRMLADSTLEWGHPFVHSESAPMARSPIAHRLTCGYDLHQSQRPDRAGQEHRPRLAQSGLEHLRLGGPRPRRRFPNC